jgi:hypothetical protein
MHIQVMDGGGFNPISLSALQRYEVGNDIINSSIIDLMRQFNKLKSEMKVQVTLEELPTEKLPEEKEDLDITVLLAEELPLEVKEAKETEELSVNINLEEGEEEVTKAPVSEEKEEKEEKEEVTLEKVTKAPVSEEKEEKEEKEEAEVEVTLEEEEEEKKEGEQLTTIVTLEEKPKKEGLFDPLKNKNTRRALIIVYCRIS